MKSTFLSLTGTDFLKALLMAVLAPVLFIIQQSIAAGALTFNWHQIEMAAIAGGVGYLIKNFFSDSVSQAQSTLVTQAKSQGLSTTVTVTPTSVIAVEDPNAKK